MRQNTPPASPFNPADDDDVPNFDDNDEDEDLIYIGDADEVLNQWEADLAENEDDDDEFLNQIPEDADEEAAGEYSAAGPQQDDAALTFTKHTGSVFCGSLHPTEDIAVTGGEDDKAYVWEISGGEIIHEVTGHSDTVIAAEFSPDGAYLATGDMAGEVQVLKLSQSYKKVWEFSMGDMVWMKWHTAANVLLAGSESGEVYVWRIPSGDCKVFASSGHKSETGQLTADGKRLIVGYGDGSVRLWDIKSSACIQEILADSPQGHTESVTCIAADPDNGMFLTGSEDGKILIAGSGGPLGSLNPASGPVESLAFCAESDIKLVACGTLQGKISLWDVGKQAVRVECENRDPSGVTRMIWAPGHNLICGTLEGSVKGFDGLTGQQKVNISIIGAFRL